MIIDTLFESQDFTSNSLPLNEYDNCTFLNCNFSNSDLSNYTFRACEFINCDLSLAKLKNTVFQDIQFNACKLLGLQFAHCNDFLFTVSFEHCILKLASFFQLKMKKTLLKSCNLSEVDFTETNLAESIFDNCDLNYAIFGQSNITGVDFRTSYNFIIDPEANTIKKAKFSKDQLAGLLEKYKLVIE